MGRYYQETGSEAFSGKFRLGVQSSYAADRFNISPSVHHIHYYFYKTNLKDVQTELNQIETTHIPHIKFNFEKLRSTTDKETFEALLDKLWEEFKCLTSQEEMHLADYILGVQVERTLKLYEYCELECEL